MIGIKTEEGIKTFANKSDKWATFLTQEAADKALERGEIKEGMIVGIVKSDSQKSQTNSSVRYFNTEADLDLALAITDEDDPNFIPENTIAVVRYE